MIWGYLSEFWNAITEVGDYSVAWFQSVGNAVAGAIGGLFENLLHHLYDVFFIFQWILDNLSDVFVSIFSPLKWIFSFLKGFWTSAMADPIAPPYVYEYSEGILEFFETIPYWNYLLLSIGAGLSILTIVFIFKRLVHF